MNAERKFLMSLQRKFFPKEFKQLSKCGQAARAKSVNKSSSISRLDPILKDGLLHVAGRLRHTRDISEIEWRQGFPLSCRRKASKLIWLSEIVKTFGHFGREHVLCLLRERFRLVKGRTTVRKVLIATFSCKKLNKLPMPQKMTYIPPEGVTPQKRIFLGRSTLSTVVYCKNVLFTYLKIKAVHIGISHNLDASSFINALRRLIARRSVPRGIRSYNGTNFTSADKEHRLLTAK